MSTAPQTLSGQCLCGAVQFAIRAPFRPILACHCRQCARWTGHAVYATAVAPERFALTSGESELAWFRASDTAQRGFCRACGSSLFWKPDSGTHVSVLAGALDPPTGLGVGGHIFTDHKSDYYEIDDDAPRYALDVGSDLRFSSQTVGEEADRLKRLPYRGADMRRTFQKWDDRYSRLLGICWSLCAIVVLGTWIAYRFGYLS